MDSTIQPTFQLSNEHIRAHVAEKTPSSPTQYAITDDIKIQCRKISKILPGCCEEFKASTKVKGSELVRQGVYMIVNNGDEIPVAIEETYTYNYSALRNINHYDKLIEFYRLQGILGVHKYMIQFSHYYDQMKGNNPGLWKDDEYLGVTTGTPAGRGDDPKSKLITNVN